MVAPTLKQRATGDTRRGAARWLKQMTAGMVFFGAILFLTAGRLDWIGGWVFLVMNALTQGLSAAVLMSRQPEMLADRSAAQAGTKSWDKFFAPAIMLVGTLAVLVTAGLDARFGWSAPVSAGLWAAAVIVGFASQIFVLWAMASNPFFATTVRIQSNREHKAVNNGPYRIVRHPGYLGSAIYNLATPLILGSWWTFIPTGITILLIVLRTRLEDRTLQAELPGYTEYSQDIHFRLFPGLW